MAASSVTGTGPGESFGLYKPQNNGSCGCTSPAVEEPKKISKKVGCFRRYVSEPSSPRYNSNSGGTVDRSCF